MHKENMYDIVIIGAGPAGMTAAIYGLRAGKRVLVLEEKVYGGQIVVAEKVENYPGVLEISGVQLATNMYNQIKSLGGEVRFEKAERIMLTKRGGDEYGSKSDNSDGDKLWKVDTDDGSYLAKALIIATGAKNRKLDLSDEDRLIGRGVSYCATCDGNFYKNKNVVVVGGGNTALVDAIYLSNIAKKVYLVHRRDKFRGEEKYVKELRGKKNVEFVLKSVPEKLVGENKLEAVVVKNMDGQVKEIKVDGIFVAVGYEPQNQLFADVLELDDGYIATKDGVHTSEVGVYVAGDARKKELKQLATAVSDGAIAADTAIKEMK